MLFSALGPVGFFVAGCVVAVLLEVCERIMLEQLLCVSSRGLSYLHMIIAITRRSSDTLCVEGAPAEVRGPRPWLSSVTTDIP